MKNFILATITLAIGTFIALTLLEPYDIEFWRWQFSCLSLFLSGIIWQYLWQKDGDNKNNKHPY